MAEGVLFELAGTVLEGLGKAAIKEAASWWGARDDLKKLEKTINLIQARVRDAERHREEDGSDAIKEWLRRLRMVLYQVDDLFDLVLTVDLQKQQMEVNKQVCVSFSRSGTLCFNWKISREIKSIRQQLDEINSDIAGLNLNAYTDHKDEPQPQRARFMRNRETCSFVKTEDVIGRETDKNIIIGMLFDPNYDDGKKITVIPIVGFGGLGKTTLAQLVFNDENVRKHFDLATWACVPEVGDQSIVMRRVYQSLTGDTDSYSPLVGQIKSGIQDSIKDKKYLLVLDDIWDDSRDSWLDLLKLLECGASGSRVIVTTRSANVAKAVGTTKAHNLGLLAEEDSWNLFKNIAFQSKQEQNNPVLTQLGKEIVDSCGHVPLAIRVVGSLLYTENEKGWRRIRNARLSEAKGKEDNNIMQVLKLSYNYLPPTLKQCFAYCSLFPKDYEYSKDDLVKLWMAQGYFDPSDTDTGERYFLELLGRNLFQDPNEDDEGNVKRCKMHDLVHDLALDIAGEEMKQIEHLDQISSPGGLMHLRIEVKKPEDDGWEVPVSLLAARKMRSLLLSGSEYVCTTIKASSLKLVILKYQSLRVLNLENMEISVVPNSVGKLRHLRYLNLARNIGIKCLPDDITRLQNLQTLKLVSCSSLKELPRDFCKLDHLRHLEIAWSGLRDLPLGFGKMKSLKELDQFVVGKSCGIDSLPPLNICELLINFRMWRSDAVVEAQRANLKDNQLLTSLELNFQPMEVTPDLSELDKMLMFLQLPPNLKDVRVDDYEGVEFPRRWLDGLSKLVSIRIDDCSNCRILPYMSRLPYLNDLSLYKLDALEFVEDEDDIWVSGGELCGSGAQNGYFPSLTTLTIWDSRSLKGWTRPATDDDSETRQLLFPRLQRMRLFECLKLTSMPLAPKLEFLEVQHFNWKVLESNLMSIDDEIASSLSSSKLFTSLKDVSISAIEDGPTYLTISSMLSNLQNLRISGCNELTSLMIESSNSIQCLSIHFCNSLEYITLGNLSVLETLFFSNLKKLTQLPEEMGNLSLLYIENCPELASLPQSLVGLTSIQELEFSRLEKLTQLPEEMGNLSLLRKLKIKKCPELASLPQSLLGLTSLQKLSIKDCPNLKERYEKPNGQDWHLLQHIPEVIM
uniref:Disease resistance protein RGA3 n=1 Tax=Chenopodium quinoa TaxID=63459 RepID=A0A803LBP3_CHEQI